MAGLSEFRNQYPQYADVPDAELADSLHAKFYSDIPKDQYLESLGMGKPSLMSRAGAALKPAESEPMPSTADTINAGWTSPPEERLSVPGSVMDKVPVSRLPVTPPPSIESEGSFAAASRKLRTSQDAAAVSAERAAMPSATAIQPGTPSAGDFAKAVKVGMTDIGTIAGKGLRYLGAEDFGSLLQSAGQRQAKETQRGMTPAGQMAMDAPIVTDEIQWGETPLASASLQALRSAPSMIAALPFGGVAAKGIEAAGGATLKALAAHPGIIGRIASLAPTAIGVGGAEGIQAALMNAAQTETEIMELPIQQLRGSPKFRELMAQADPAIPLAQRERQVRAAIAKLASDEVARRTFVSTGGIGILTGGGAQGVLLRQMQGKGAKTILGAAGKGAVEEVIQETPQSASEQYIQNVATQNYVDPTASASQGVISAGLSGGIVGGLTGGVMGAGGRILSGPPGQEKAPPPRAELDAILASDKPVAEILAAKAPAAAPQAPPQAPLQPAAFGWPDIKTPAVATLPDGQIITGQIAGIQDSDGQPMARFVGADGQVWMIQPGEADIKPAPAAAKRQRKSAFVSSTQFSVDTEDNGKFDVTVHRTASGDVVVNHPDGLMEYKAAFANGKTDAELLAYGFEPVGFRSAAQAPAGDGTRTAPVQAETAEHVKIAEQQVDTNPTEAMKNAGNYQLGHLAIQGLDIAIENPAGSVRSGVDKAGKPWANTLNHTYGFLKGATAADGDKLDVFIGPDPQSQQVFVIDQIDPDTERYDEAKTMLGFNSLDEARAAYLSNYDAGWKGVGAITPLSMPAFKAWIAKGATHKPLAYDQKAAIAERKAAADTQKAGEAYAAEREKAVAAIGEDQVAAIEDQVADQNAGQPTIELYRAIATALKAEAARQATQPAAPAQTPAAPSSMAQPEPVAAAPIEAQNDVNDVSVSDSFKSLPDYAQQAIGEHHMEQVTNRKVHPGLINAEWEKITVPVDNLKAKNELHFDANKQREYAGRKIYNTGPVVLDRNGELIDGNHRFNKAVRDGQQTIEVYRPKAVPSTTAIAGNAVSAAPPVTPMQLKMRKLAEAKKAKREAAKQGEANAAAEARPESPLPAVPQEARQGASLPEQVAPEARKAEKRSFKELAALSNEAQERIDALHGRLEAQGVSWEDQNKAPEVMALYDERIAYDTAAAQKGYDGSKSVVEKVLSGLPHKTTYASIDSILRERYSLTDNPQTGVYMMSKYTGESIDDPETVVDVARDISHLIVARDYPNADYFGIMESNMSALTATGKAKILSEARAKAEQINEGLREFFTKDETSNVPTTQPAPEALPGQQRPMVATGPRLPSKEPTYQPAPVSDAAVAGEGSDRGAVAEERAYTKGQAEVLAPAQGEKSITQNKEGAIYVRGYPEEQMKAARDSLGIRSAVISPKGSVFPVGTPLAALKEALNPGSAYLPSRDEVSKMKDELREFIEDNKFNLRKAYNHVQKHGIQRFHDKAEAQGYADKLAKGEGGNWTVKRVNAKNGVMGYWHAEREGRVFSPVEQAILGAVEKKQVEDETALNEQEERAYDEVLNKAYAALDDDAVQAALDSMADQYGSTSAHEYRKAVREYFERVISEKLQGTTEGPAGVSGQAGGAQAGAGRDAETERQPEDAAGVAAPAEKLGEKIPPSSPEVVTSPPAVAAESVPNSPNEFEHAGYVIRKTNIKRGDQVVQSWAVQSEDNRVRAAKGERQIGGDAIVDTPEQAKRQAEDQVTERGQKAERQRQFAEQDAAEEAKKEANRGLSITQRRANAALDKPTNLPVNAGVGRGTRREAMESAVSQERAINAVDVRDTAAYKRDEDEQGRLHRAGYGAFFGNDSHPQKMRFNELSAKLKNRDNYQKKEYRLYMGRDTEGSFYDITKTEYDYAQTLIAAKKAEASTPAPSTPTAKKEPWQYGELEFGDKYIDEVVLPQLRKDLENAHGGKFQEYKSKAAAVRGLKERIDTLENHRDAKARKYYASLDNHYGAVRAALADGKPVPPVAYESYDDLKADVSAGRIKGDGQEVARVEQPQHIEAGQAEPATAPVIAASIKESAKNTPMNIEQAREWLLKQIDAALIDAKSAAEEDVWDRAEGKVDLKGRMDVKETIGYKVFDVPGDGRFSVLNLKESLQKFKKQVAATPGFKKNATRPMSVANGSGGKTSVRDMLEDGEYVLAVDYGRQIGEPLLFGAVRKGEAHPIAYTNSEPVDIKGIEAQVGREWNVTGKSFSWRVIETTTGVSVSSETTKERAVSKAKAYVDEHGADKLIAQIKETPKVSQSELERQFTDWGSEEEAKAQKTRDAVERADTEDRALWNSIFPLKDGEKRSPNPWNDIDHMQVVILAKDAAKAGKGDEFVSLIERRRGGTNNMLALAARKALADAAPKTKPAKGSIATGVASKILGDIYQRAAYNKWKWDRLKSYLTREMEDAGVGKSRMASALEKAMTEYARTANGRLGYPNSNLVFSAMRDYGLIAEEDAGAAKAEQAKGYPFYSSNKLFNAEGTAELPKDWTGVARSDSGKRFFYLGQENGERSFNPLKAESYEDALKEAEGLKNDKPVIPEGYREVARGYFGGTVEKPIYAPFSEGERVRFIGGHAGQIQSFIGGPVTTGAIIKYDNGLTGRAEWRDVEAMKAAVAQQAAPEAGKPAADRIDAAKRRLREADTDEKRATIEREIRQLRQEAAAEIQPEVPPQAADRAPSRRITKEQRAEMVDQYGEAYARGFMAQRDGFSIEPASDIRSKADKEKFKDGWIAASDLATKEPAQGAEKVGAGETATKERFEYPNPKYTSPSDLPAMRAVVDYMNGDITRDAMTQIIVDSGLPEGTIRSITNRLGEDSYSNGEIADIKRRQAAAKEPDTGIAFNSIAEFADPSKEESERVQAGIEGKDIIGAAQWLVDNAPPMHSAIASKVLASLKRQQSDGMVFEFHVMHPGDSVPMAATRGRGATSYNFDFRKNVVAVWINGADVVGKVGTSYETVLHELVHAVTVSATAVGRKAAGTEMQKHVFDLEDVTNAVIDHFNQRVKDAAAGKVELTEFEKSIQGRGSNAFASIDETLAWTLSSPDAQAYLEAIPYKSKSAWTAFVEAIRKILGLTPRHDTALSEVLRVSEAIMEDGGREMRGLLGLDGIQHGTLQASNGSGVMYSGAVSKDGPLNSLEDDQRSAVSRAIDRAIAIEQGKDVKPLQVIRVRNRIGKLRADMEAGKISEALFISQVESLHAQMEIAAESRRYAPIVGRARGADFLRQKLLEAKRRGDISEQAADMAEWLILKNPALVDDLGIGVRTPTENQKASGNYNPLNRVMTLFKESASDTTAVHEILHHLERMMPAEMQAEIRKEWRKAATKELLAAQKAKDQRRIDYFTAVLAGDQKKATELLTGKGMDGFNAVEPAPTFKAVDTESAEFKAWFGKSAVVDAKGKPLRVYHATPQDIVEFKTGRGGFSGPAIWLSGHADFQPTAHNIGRSIGDMHNYRTGVNVMPVYAAISSPLVIDSAAALKSAQEQFAGGAIEFPQLISDSIIEKLRAAGHDGVVFRGTKIKGWGNKSDEYIVFRPEQIKSAISNTGAFDPSNPDIRQDLAIGQDYQYLNPSEFWAVRMTNTAQARFEAKSIWARSLQWLREALEHIKGALGLKSDHPLLKALDDLIARGTGEFVSKEMLGSSEVYASIEESGPEEVAGVVMRDVSLAARLLLHPRQIAANHKPFVPVFDTAIKQFEERDRIVSGLGEMAKPYFELTHAQRLNVNKIVEQGRLDRTVYTVADLENGIHHAESGDLVTLDAEEIGAYKALRRTFNEALSLFRDTMLEEFGFAELIPEQKAAAKLRQMIADGEIEESRIEWARHVAKAIDEIEQAKRTGYAPFNRYGQFVVAVKALPAGVEVQDDDGKQFVTGIPEFGDDPMTQIVTDLGGQYDVYRDGWVIDDTRKAVLRALETTLFATKVEVNAFNEWRKQGKDVTAIPEVKAAFDEARRKHGNVPNSRVLAFHITEKAKADDANLSTFDELARISDVDVETWDAVREKLQEAIKAKSFRKHFFGSDNTPGYSTDFERSVADYIIGMSGYLARRKHVKDFDNAIKRIKAPALAKYAEDYRKYVNAPADEFALLKNIGFLYYIAGSTATAVANLTQVPMLAMPTLVQFVPHHIAAREVARAWGETLAMFSPTTTGLQMFDPDKVPADVRDVFKTAWEDQLFVPLETLDLMATSSIKTVGGRKTMRALSVTTQAIAYMFMFAERLNRITTFIAAARISRMKVAKDRMRDVVKSDAWARHSIGGRAWGERNFAEWAVDESQYRMGKVNRPTVMRGVGSPLLQFKGYMIQTLEAGYRMAVMHGKGGKPAALAALAMMLMLGGIWGLPGLEDLRDMIERLYKVNTGKDLDLKTEIRQLIARETGSASLAAAANKGIPYATVGVDMSRVGMGNIIPDSALQVGGIPVDLAIARPMRAAEKMAAGKTTEAMSEFLPNFLKNPAMGLQWKRDGLRDKYGSRVMTPGEFDYGDVAIKSLGWTPTKVTNRREYTYAESRAERGIDELKRRYTNDLVRAYVHEAEAKDQTEKSEYKADQAKILARIEEHNKTASPENLIKLDPQTLRRKAAAEFSGSSAREGKERKLSRGAAQDRRELFQLGR